jgi:hypothetical protein
MATVVEVLRVARELFAGAPSHVPYPEVPVEGTYDMLLATQQAALELSDVPLALWDPAATKAMRGADDALRAAAGTPRLADWCAGQDTATVLACFDHAIEATT